MLQGSCGCGLTASCDSPTVKCNCDLGGGVKRYDIGLIIDKSALPVTTLTSTLDSNVFTVGPVRCAEKQFGELRWTTYQPSRS
jgi:hypothetical protein